MCSELDRQPLRARLKAAPGLAAALAVAATAAAAFAGSGEIPSLYDALATAFPGADIERRTYTLTAEQQAEAARLAGEPLPHTVIFAYHASLDGRPVGTAYFDAHRVRTLPQTLMIIVEPDGRLRSIEVLSFREPPQYKPSAAWLNQFRGRCLDEDLQLRRGIQGITGATLTARATTKAARRALALHAVLSGIPADAK
ncbi:MAG: FMN-binding protein [Kiritimatiellae bacterium]|nr:FMN-binding protein [Kiritimatiellia bacterium]MDW8459373.1 FMN-binding protein [Verrucomicrobiota bacterium]